MIDDDDFVWLACAGAALVWLSIVAFTTVAAALEWMPPLPG